MEQRVESLRRLRNGLVEYDDVVRWTLQVETGKPRWEAEDDCRAAVQYLEWLVDNHQDFFSHLSALASAYPGSGDVGFRVGLEVVAAGKLG